MKDICTLKFKFQSNLLVLVFVPSHPSPRKFTVSIRSAFKNSSILIKVSLAEPVFGTTYPINTKPGSCSMDKCSSIFIL
jgi:hypothetical protein